MRHDIVTVTTGYLVDDEQGISLDQLCHTCGLSVDAVIELVEEGVLKVQGQRSLWKFSSDNIHRALVANRLKRDLEINLAGIAVTLDLLEQLEDLRSRLRTIEARQNQPETN